MSNPDLQHYANPLTAIGVHLHDEAALGLPLLRIEECGYAPRGLPWNYDDVISPFWRLYWNSRPGSHLRVGPRRYPLGPAAVILVPEGLRFDTRGPAGVPHLWLHFTVLPHLSRASASPRALPVTPAIRGAIRALTQAWLRAIPPWRIYHRAQALLHATLADFDGFRRRAALPGPLHRLLAHIHLHAAAPLDNADLAQRCGRSVEGFIRWFHQHLGVTPQHYVRQSRVRQAAQELAASDLTIDEIAARNGFPNRNYFTRVFARATRLPPAAYRARAQRQRA
jgi:AraC-like DNA-binding protein